MTNKEPIAKAGQLLMIDKGIYSDYSVVGFFLVLKEFNPQKEIKKFILNKRSSDHNCYITLYEITPYCYITLYEITPYLITQGFLLEIEYANLYLGEYCIEDEMSFKTPGGIYD